MTPRSRPYVLAALLSVLLVGCGASGSSGGSPSAPVATTAGPSSAAATPSATPVASSSAATAAPSDAPIAAIDAHLVGEGGLVALAIGPDGALYVSECAWSHAAIDRIDSHGILTIVAGTGDPGFSGDGGPATSAELYCPRGMAFGADGALYFGDHVNNRVRRIDTAGIITTVAGSGPAGLNQGSWSGDGGPATKATLQEPEHVVFDQAGNLYISDRDNDRIRKIAPDGTISTIAGNGTAGFSGDGGPGSQASISVPYSVVVDAVGDLIFADGGNNRLRMIDRNGIITTVAGNGTDATTGDGGAAMKAALEPQHLAIDAAGNLYVTDDKTNRLRRIDSHGVITTMAGNGTAGVPVDGTKAVDAPLGVLGGVAVDDAGNVYLTDLFSVYRIDAKGTITRIAGARD